MMQFIHLFQKKRKNSSQSFSGQEDDDKVKGMSYLTKVQLALGHVIISKGVSSLIFGAVLSGRGSSTCSTRLP